MAPGFPAGARVLLKRVKSVIAWGEVHVIDTVDGPVLKRIDQTDDPDVFVLRSDNPAYQPIRIDREDIRGVWRVLLRMIQ
jgi:phage repressor protein C with HTH and peptisase S24 domain